MKKILISAISMLLLCATVIALGSCSLFQSRQEVEAGSVWVLGDISIESSKDAETELDAYDIRIKRSTYVMMHSIGVWDENNQIQTKIDTVEFTTDGKVMMNHHSGVGDASFVNGTSVYHDSTTESTEIGTYSGKKIELTDYAEAYISEDVLYLVEEVEDDSNPYNVILMFTKTN